ncbi:MAG: hypothetical protein JST26_18725 [Bacteroidetes bacterium]|nr:hypothetical protein [Bacteroidota bacterium]
MTILYMVCFALLAACVREFAGIRTYLKRIDSLDKQAIQNQKEIIQ